MTDHETALARLDERVKALEKLVETQQEELIALRPLRSVVEGLREAVKYHWYLLGGIVLGLIGIALQIFGRGP